MHLLNVSLYFRVCVCVCVHAIYLCTLYLCIRLYAYARVSKWVCMCTFVISNACTHIIVCTFHLRIGRVLSLVERCRIAYLHTNINLIPPSFRCLLLTFSVFNLLYSTLSLLLAVLFYKYYIAHVVCISLIVLVVTWNGSTFYIDVFAAKASKPTS